MIKKIIVRRSEADLSLLSDVDMHPVLKRVFIHRGIVASEELQFDLRTLLPFSDLLYIDEATILLSQAFREKWRIVIVGDYDVDGATGTVLLMQGLKALGAAEVNYIVPDRFADGYGMSAQIVEQALIYQPQLIITVDNGIASIEGVNAAHAHGIKVIITDHHLPGPVLPNAEVIVNPNQPGDRFASKNLSGVGVAFYVLIALRAHLRAEGWFEQTGIKEPNLADYLDLVALGTVADLVPIDRNNRILVMQGLNRIQSNKCRPAIRALIATANKTTRHLTAFELGYLIGPRLNAAGRLKDMSLGISCLLSENEQDAFQLALELQNLNEERQQIGEGMRQEALKVLEEMFERQGQNQPCGICLLNETWHQGVIGILAAKIKDRFQRPVIAFALQSPTELKGSARSIDGIHIREVLATISTEHPGLLTKFGGHAMAAGLSLPKAHYETFMRAFNQEVSRRMSGQLLPTELLSDGELLPDDLNLELANILRYAAPWGSGFAQPLFDGRFQLVKQDLIHDRHLKMVLRHGGQLVEAIAFDVDNTLWPNENCEFVHIAYHLNIDEYRGRRKVKLIAEHVEAI